MFFTYTLPLVFSSALVVFVATPAARVCAWAFVEDHARDLSVVCVPSGRLRLFLLKGV